MDARRGMSLVELVVALLLLEIAGLAALTAALTADRLGRRAAVGSATDRERWERYRAAEVLPSCRGAAVPDSTVLRFAATEERDSLTALVRCGS
ncbi:MAG: hypothetical protein ABJC19_07155 [Gemmatimonadota bacterium]